MKLSVKQSEQAGRTSFTITFGEAAFAFHVDLPQLRVACHDFAVWPVLLYAMRHQQSIEVEQPVSNDLLFNADILQSFLCRHLKLAPIEIRAASPSACAPADDFLPGTILPFSGGVDSCFSLFYNHFALGRKIDAAVMVKGLDLFDEEEFRRACAGCEKLTAVTDTKLIVMSTTVRERFVTPLGWKLHSDFMLAGVLHLFHAAYGRAFISGDGDGGLLSVQQCFQVPFLNERLFFLFSNARMAIQVFEGAYHNKIQKVEYLAQFPEVRQNLRVCWKSKKHSNCGQCRKCVMNQLFFLAVTGEIPPCFPIPASEAAVGEVLAQVRQCQLTDPDSPAVILPKYFGHILRQAASRGVTHPLIELVRSSQLAKCD